MGTIYPEYDFPGIDTGATGRHVYKLLREQGFMPRETAHILGLSDSQAVYNWKYGSRMPSIDNLDRISRMLETSINDLLVHNGDEEVIDLRRRINACKMMWGCI